MRPCPCLFVCSPSTEAQNRGQNFPFHGFTSDVILVNMLGGSMCLRTPGQNLDPDLSLRSFAKNTGKQADATEMKSEADTNVSHIVLFYSFFNNLFHPAAYLRWLFSNIWCVIWRCLRKGANISKHKEKSRNFRLWQQTVHHPLARGHTLCRFVMTSSFCAGRRLQSCKLSQKTATVLCTEGNLFLGWKLEQEVDRSTHRLQKGKRWQTSSERF